MQPQPAATSLAPSVPIGAPGGQGNLEKWVWGLRCRVEGGFHTKACRILLHRGSPSDGSVPTPSTPVACVSGGTDPGQSQGEGRDVLSVRGVGLGL